MNFIKMLAGAAAVVAMVTSAMAGIYKYQDETGRIYFVDGIDKIPPKYRQKTETRQSDISYNWVYFNTDTDANYYYDKATLSYSGKNLWSVIIKQSFNDDKEYYVINFFYNCITRNTHTETLSRVAPVNQPNQNYHYYSNISQATERVLLNMMCN